jgi:hypothetical protein
MILLIGFIAIIAMPSVLWLYALADAMINAFQTFGVKIIWILVLCFFPPVGTVLYYLIGRSQRRTFYPVGRFVLICILILPIIATIAFYISSPEPNIFIEPSAPPPPSKSIQIQLLTVRWSTSVG